jgi:hypothetical protein
MASYRRRRRGRAEHRWRRIVDEWRQSGQSASEFSAARGFEKGTLYFWSCRLRKVDASQETTNASETPCLVPVQVVEDGPLSHQQKSHESLAIEVTLSGGDKIAVPQGADLLQFSQIVAVLRGDWP